MITDEIREELFKNQDLKYRDFQAKLIPGFETDAMIGVRTPELRALAKEFSKRDDIDEFLQALPHRYFDEDQLHAFLISGIKEFEKCVACVNEFLPYVNNWATCDQMSPKIFRKHKEALLPYIHAWLASEHTYTVRFGIGMLMQHYLDEDFDSEYPELISGIRSDEYYINMMIAWYFATALAKQYDAVLPYLEEKKLDRWTHNKTIQKAVESYRISDEQKQYLRGLRIRSGKNRAYDRENLLSSSVSSP